MKYMIIILSVFALASCGVRKNNSKSETRVVDKTENAIVSETTAMSESTKEAANISLVDKSENKNIASETEKDKTSVRVDFDTDKPVNPQTGLSPIKSITIEQTGEKASLTDKTKATEAIKEESLFKEDHFETFQSTKEDNSKLNIIEESKEVVKAKHGAPGYMYVCVGIVATLVLSLALWIYKQINGGGIKSLLSKLK